MKIALLRKRLASALVITTGLVLSVASISFASNYNNIYFSFDYRVKGPTRPFDGQNIAFEAFAISHPFRGTDKSYQVTLIRDNGWFSFPDKIGITTFPRDAFGRAEWSNVGPGNYFLFLEKSEDGITLTDSTARIYNF